MSMRNEKSGRIAVRALFCCFAVLVSGWLFTGCSMPKTRASASIPGQTGEALENGAGQTGNSTIGKGIFVGPVSLEGRNADEAAKALEEYEESLKEKKLTITVGKDTIETTLGELDFAIVDHDFVTQALQFASAGNPIKRYKEQKDREREPVVYEPEFTLSDDKVKELLKTEAADYNKKAKNAGMAREDGRFVITKEKPGRKLSVNETLEKVKEAIQFNQWDGNDLIVEAVTKEVEPKYTSELFARCKDVLGTFSTTFATSSASRANNLANAARLLNGTIIYPGEVFSAGKSMSPISAANGYSMAGAYQQGKLIDSIGGGVCQVSTTLYNAILQAELEVVERHNHSMIVTYVQPAMDAAIAGEGNGKDLKFKNNTDVPIYMEVYTVGRKITFTLYGEETRDLERRTVKYESEIIERIQPGPDKVTEDPEKPADYEKVEQGAHVGYKANLWKIVYMDGKQVGREKVNYSYYAAEPRYVTKGTKEVETPTPKPSKSPKPTRKPKPTPDIEEPEEPDVTPEPTMEPTPAPAPTPEPAPTVEPELPEEDITVE